MINQLMAHVQAAALKKTAPKFDVGDTVEVRIKIKEGDKERIQPFTGVVITASGTGSNAMFKVRRLVQNEGVERTFPLYSPLIESVVVKRSSKVRQARLYYLRDRVGKATRLKERRRHVVAETEPTPPAQA
jgi:large subunit ribosomal protein L19